MNDLISRKWLIECVEEGWVKFETEKDKNKFIHLVRDTAPPAQPEVTEEAIKDYCRKRCLNRRRCLTILTNDYFYKLMSAQPEAHEGEFEGVCRRLFRRTGGTNDWRKGHE